jgi:transposase InsO family protein
VGGNPQRKHLTDAQMLTLTQAIHVEFKDACGSPRMVSELRLHGFPASKKRVERLIHHSDRGNQYASLVFQAKLKVYGMICFVSRKGNCWDNAPTESWFGGFKNERVYGERFETRDEVIAMTFECIEIFYNRRRLRSTLCYKSPIQFLNNWISDKRQKKLVA